MAPLESREHEPMRSGSDEEEDSNIISAFQISGAVVFPMVMQAANELKLLDIISEAGSDAHLSAQEIVSHLPTNNPNAPDMVDRILRLLASYSVLTCTLKSKHEGGDDDDDDGAIQRLYGLSPVSKYYTGGSQEGISLAPAMQLVQCKVFMDSWYALKDAILEGGIPFNKVHGVHAFEYPGKDPKFNLVFNNAMISLTNLFKKVLYKYKGFEEIKELVDVGGGLGLTLSMITSMYPTIKAINFDLPHVIQEAPPYPGVQHVPGDMFVSIPKAEAILMKCVLHDWSDEHSLKILRNCHAALPENGKVIVIELIAPEAPETTVAAQSIFNMDLMMLTQNPQGKERTKRAFEFLSKKAGFQGVRFECYVCNYWVMEFYK